MSSRISPILHPFGEANPREMFAFFGSSSKLVDDCLGDEIVFSLIVVFLSSSDTPTHDARVVQLRYRI
jgi:hypothetical protein